MNKYQEAFQKVVIEQFGRIIPKEKREYVSALRELVKKATPKKPYAIKGCKFLFNCPSCDENIMKSSVDEQKYCPYCGQRLEYEE